MGTSELVNGLKAPNCTYLPDKKGSHPEKKIIIKKNIVVLWLWILIISISISTTTHVRQEYGMMTPVVVVIA